MTEKDPESEAVDATTPPSRDEPTPITTIEEVGRWYIETDRAERAAQGKLPKLFERGEGIETPLPD